jgi:GTP-binding protein
LFDKVLITVKAGDGGDGAISFRHEKYAPFGGPDGGDGGDGGDVVLLADPAVSSLRAFRNNRLYKAARGENGRGQKKHGKRGDDLVLKVPVGTIIIEGDDDGGILIADCSKPDQREVAARGGQGGLGNVHFTSSTNQAPRIAQKGEAGEELTLTLELRLIADVGIIGFPNAGKSTLLTAASAARPRIAGYPFTTLEPVLGMVETGISGIIWAEIPGLIEGAHLGKGLGHEFLRHVMRTKILIHLIDGTSRSPVEDMMRVNTELTMYDSTLAQKPQIVTVNKIDLPEVAERMDEIKKAFGEIGITMLFVSANTGEGVPALIAETMKVLSRAGSGVRAGRQTDAAVFRPQPKKSGFKIRKDGDVFIVEAPSMERIIARVDLNNPEVTRQLQRPLTKLGVRRALEKAGIRPGDKVRCGDYEWEW